MIAAVPTISPASVRDVWTGCFRNRSTAMPRTSRSSTASGARGADAQTVGERRRAGQDDALALAQSGGDLRLVQPEEAHGDVAPPRAAVLVDVDEPAVAVAQQRRAGHDERIRLLPRDDLDLDGGVGGQLRLDVRDLAHHVADLPARLGAQPGRD